jgi:hypothetical protein
MKKLIGLALLLSSTYSIAQDTHYWTYRFGTKAALMGGPAIGGLEDNSSVVYNPALLSFVKDVSVSLNANIYQLSNIKAKDGAGSGLDVSSSQFSAVPTTVSGLLPKRQTNRFTVGYAITVPTEFSFKTSARLADKKDIVAEADSKGAEEYVGQFSNNTRLSENMISLGMAYKLTDKLSVGLTHSVIYRSHTYTKTELARMILNNTAATLVSTGETQTIEYTNLRYAAKVGIAYKSGTISAGLTVSGPSVVLGGSGTIARDITADNLQINTQLDPKKTPNYARIFVSANDRQTALKTTYKSPLSIAGGFVYANKRTTLAIGAEWFAAISIYNIMSPQDNLFKRPTNLALDGTKFLEVNASNKSVFNWSVGYHRVVTPNLSLSTGFRTNNSFYDRTFDNRVIQTTRKTLTNNPLILDISSWNIYHFVLGGTFSQERRDISLGINVSFAAEGSLKQFANFDKPTEASFLMGQQTTTNASFLSYGLLLGYTFRFKSANGRQ